VLLAFRGPQCTVEVVSANTQALLGRAPEQLLGRPLEEVLSPEVLACLEVGSGPGSVRVELQGRAFVALWHTSDGLTVLELEPAEAGDGAEEHALEGVRRLIAPLPGTEGTQPLLQSVAGAVRDLTGFDRVMVYRFDADWHGEVLAESRREGVDSFLGMHFPASDIPAQARALYTRSPLRLIVDARAGPVALLPPVLPGTVRPLDLSGAALRSVSPVHLEYLRNMGVEASFSLSLLKDGKLWGLIACHHHAPRHISYERRRACEVLTRLLSLRLSAEERTAEATEHARRVALQGRLTLVLGQGASLAETLPRFASLVLELTGASGAALLLGERPLLVGATPTESEVEALAAWLAAQSSETVFFTERLAEAFPALAHRADVAAGLLAVRLEPRAPRFVLWFRREVARTVTWAGNPQKPVVPEPGEARLHPRASFRAWEETVRGASRPWTRADAEAAESFRGVLVGVVLRQAEELNRLAVALSRSNSELDAFGHTIAHDLHEPLRGIRQYAEFIHEDYGEKLGEEGRGHLDSIRWLAKHSGDMVDGLLNYSRLGHVELAWGEVEMQEVLDAVLRSLSVRLGESQVEVRLPRRLPQVLCDGIRIQQVWANLLTEKPGQRLRAGGTHLTFSM
jgi:light-regulated signal transduction histidine kinase (bacteriophytochrome)